MEKDNPSLEAVISEFYADPLGFVYFTFTWGADGTPLANEEGPDTWQIDILTQLGNGALNVSEAIRLAVSSGHGIGKTTLIAWIILWFISTRVNPQIIVTANTETQLTTKTWRELAKWHNQAINKAWFVWTATKFYHVDHPETWFATAIPWSINKSESFAGAHERDVLIIFDEASAIDDVIWETAEGAMTTSGAIWVAFGNMTRNRGRFVECFGRFKHRWITRQIDSRTAKKADKTIIKEWIADYGEDSDFVRVRVRGLAPRAGSSQFIPADVVDNCRKYIDEGYYEQAKVLGVDVARFGDDQTVFIIRQGRKAHKPIKYRGKDTMQVADLVLEQIRKETPDYVMIDGVGVGGGVVDRLRQLGFGNLLYDVNAGSKPIDGAVYFNKRAEMWGLMREWLKAGGDLPDDIELCDELCIPEYGFSNTQQIQIESKKDIKKRGLGSPDCADALSLTFFCGTVLPKTRESRQSQLMRKLRTKHGGGRTAMAS